MRPDRPRAWTIGTPGTPRDASTPTAARLGPKGCCCKSSRPDYAEARFRSGLPGSLAGPDPGSRGGWWYQPWHQDDGFSVPAALRVGASACPLGLRRPVPPRARLRRAPRHVDPDRARGRAESDGELAHRGALVHRRSQESGVLARQPRDLRSDRRLPCAGQGAGHTAVEAGAPLGEAASRSSGRRVFDPRGRRSRAAGWRGGRATRSSPGRRTCWHPRS